MPEYLVTWTIDIEAGTPAAAAWQAWKHMRAVGSHACCFKVEDPEAGTSTSVDLLHEPRPEPGNAASFVNHYRCDGCGHVWQDEWSATCDDDCPECGRRHLSPFKSEDATS